MRPRTQAPVPKLMPVADYPQMVVPVDHIEPVPRRVRAFVGGAPVLDTTRALYVWEWPSYPQYYIPLADVDPAVLVDESRPEKLGRGPARRHGLRVGEIPRPGVAHVYGEDALAGLAGTVRFGHRLPLQGRHERLLVGPHRR